MNLLDFYPFLLLRFHDILMVDNYLRKNTLIDDAPGTLDLNIARLERHIKILEQQLIMSAAYPYHKNKLAEEKSQIQSQLRQLLQHRDKLQ